MSRIWVLLALVLLTTNCYTILKIREVNNMHAASLQREQAKSIELQRCKRELKETLGTQAGDAIKQVKASAAETYSVLNEQAEESKEELEKIAQSAIIALNKQAEKTTHDLQKVTNEMLKTLSRELEKFNETAEA